jgi:hypothetical protein
MAFAKQFRFRESFNFYRLSNSFCFKTHLSVPFLPDDLWMKKPKMIYTLRNARDVAISNYHFGKHFGNASLSSALDDRKNRLNFWNVSDYSNILYLTYEPITSNIDETIRKVSDFSSVEVSDKFD